MTIKQEIDSYGFETLVVETEEGGTLRITSQGGKTDIARIVMMSPKGLGSATYVRLISEIEDKVERIKRIVWLTEKEQQACITFLQTVVKDNARKSKSTLK